MPRKNRWTIYHTQREVSFNHWFRQNGTKEMVAALAVLLLLLLGNILVALNKDALQNKDTRNQPPTNSFLQWLLMKPSLEIVEVTQGEVSGIDFYGTPGASLLYPKAAQETRPRPRRRPSFTAVAGKGYTFNAVLKDFPDVRYALVRAPEGMGVSPTGQLSWTPKAEQAGIYKISLDVLPFAGTGHRLSWEVSVSEKPHALGTDQSGRDILACLILGTQWTLLPGLIAVLISIPLSLLFGGMAGYYGGMIETFLSHGITLFSAMPSLVLIFLTGAIFNFNIYAMMAVLGVVLFPRNALQIKNKVLSLKENQFIEAARELGMSDRRILLKDILWHNARTPVLSFCFQIMAFAILIEVTLSYLNLGIKEPDVSWGKMIFDHRSMIQEQKLWPLFFPAVTIFLSVAAFYLLADGLNKRNKIRGV